MRRTLSITNALFAPGNGLATTVADVSEALGADVLQFDASEGGETDASRRAQAFGAVHRIAAHSFAGTNLLPRRAKRHAAALTGGYELLIAHSFFQPHVAWTRSTARNRGQPFWLVPNGTLDPWVFGKRTLLKRAWVLLFGRSVVRDAAAVVCATTREAKKVRDRFEGARTEVVFWPVRPGSVLDRPVAREALSIRYSIPFDARVLLYFGRLDAMKRPVEAIEAFRRVSSKTDWLLVAGPDYGAEAACREAAEGCNRIVFAGALGGQEKLEACAGSDAFVSLSWRENFGYTTAECLAAGTPVILSPGHDLADEIRSTACGWLLETFSSGEADAALRDCLTAPASRLRDLGERGRIWSNAHLTMTRFQSSLLSLAERTRTQP